MIDLEKVRKEYTREEFQCKFSGYVCPGYFGLKEPKDKKECFDLYKGNCYLCMKEAVKDLKFKDDIEGEKMENKELKKVINYRKICNELKSKNELNEKSLLVLKGHIEALEKEKDILEKSNSELQELNLKYYNEYKDLKSENEELKKEINRIQKVDLGLARQIEEFKKTLDLCHETIKNGSEKIESLKKIIKEML
jgi:DNA repair exonuclease SbcCD ATPase subunit